MAICILRKQNTDFKDITNYKYYEGEPSNHVPKEWPGYVYIGHAKGLKSARQFILEMCNRRVKT